MSLLDFLENLTIGPLKVLFDAIFSAAYYVSDNPGLSIIALSIAMNILVLPLYRRADAMQEQARDTDAKLHKGVSHIKKAFSGDEQMMILQAYYRENNYRPTDALRGSVSLLLEIPFFMAAYQFLSHSQALCEVSFGPIRDLGAPDGLLVIGSLTLNLLPILMTAINCISSALYLKGFPLKTKVQLYAMALFFLIFLYDSPAGLVFYWTLNNLFSLVKNIFYKLKHPRQVLCLLCFGAGIAGIWYGLQLRKIGFNWYLIPILGGAALMLPLLVSIALHYFPLPARKKAPQAKPNYWFFLLSGLFLTVLTGALIPSAVIASSPQEFVDIRWFYHPLWYIASATTLAAGTFLVWMGMIYWLANDRWKVLFQRLMWVLCAVMLVNYLFFGTKLGMLSARLQYIEGMDFSAAEMLVNLLVVLVVAIGMYLLAMKFSRQAAPLLLTALVAISCMSAWNGVQIKKSVDETDFSASDAAIQLPLSKDGKNVVVLMLDRAIGEYIPYLFNEKPELVEQFDGFTYYPHTISFGGFTNYGSPPLWGGYEYTPVEMNRRSEESLVSKHNEALKVMPTLFADSGFQVTVCDPTYANYSWIPDLSIYKDDPRIDTYITKGAFIDEEERIQLTEFNRQNFFMFGIMKCMPLATQKIICCGGTYLNSAALFSHLQTIQSMSTAKGISSNFLDPYNVLANLPNVTAITEGKNNTFLMMVNDTTHEPALLQEPEYVPAEKVDNTAYDAEHADRFTLNGRTLSMDTSYQLSHYQTNMAVMLRLGDWFDYLRENGVYDNTRIILVSDHGYGIGHLNDLMIQTPSSFDDLEYYLPLLMVKDFDAQGFTTCEDFMTNADVPTLATAELVEDPTNPYTGKPIDNSEKYAHDQFVVRTYQWDKLWNTVINNGNTFLPSGWASVKDNPLDPDNWVLYDGHYVLDQHSAP